MHADRIYSWVNHSLRMRPHPLLRPPTRRPLAQPAPPTNSRDRRRSSTEELDALLVAAMQEFESSQGEAITTTKLIYKAKTKQARPFAKPVSTEDIDKAMLGAVPEKTRRDTRYCERMWEEWAEHRATSTGTALPCLKDMTKSQLQHYMSCFVLEVRKKDGSEFPPNSIHHICCGIMRFLRSNGKPELDIFKDKELVQFRVVLDSEMKRLQGLGIGTAQRKAEPITFEEEELLWQKGILGDSSPQSLLDTMFYMNGLYFALRGGKEHRNLRHEPSQIQLVEKLGERPYLLYREDVSKNHPGGLRGRKIKPKVVEHHDNIQKPERCFIRLYKLYHSLCPSDRLHDAYYLQPLQNPQPGCWYSSRPVGHTKLDKTISRMCKAAGILGYRTNHSLRATAATRLHQSKCVEEQEIMARTGHRSIEAVRSYKRASTQQQEQVSDILSNGHPTKRSCNALAELDYAVSVPPAAQFNPPQVNSVSLGYSSTNATPVFNFTSCASVTINYAK